MIALILFLFIGGQKKPAKPAPLPAQTYTGDPCGEHICSPPLEASSGYVVIPTNNGATAVKLSDAEYSNLQALRKSVADEEKRLAVKYGAEPENVSRCLVTDGEYCLNFTNGIPRPADHFEYHGQFLLIEKGKQ